MLLVTSSKSKKLMCVSFIQHVTVNELEQGVEDVKMALSELPDGFKLLVDLSNLESMDLDCAVQIGNVMELCDRKNVGLVVRIIPDPAKDIGLNILTVFHYRHKPRVATCQTITEAIERLSL
jgi:anti-anti-sigma regulatory factor